MAIAVMSDQEAHVEVKGDTACCCGVSRKAAMYTCFLASVVVIALSTWAAVASASTPTGPPYDEYLYDLIEDEYWVRGCEM
jgi:hypothetical protein